MIFGNELLTVMCWRGNTFMSHGTIDEDAKIPEIERGTSVVVAWHQRGRSSGYPVPRVRHLSAPSLSYLKDARAIGRAVPVAEPLVPATFKIPGDALRQLRAYSAITGLTLSAILTRAVKSYLTSAARQRRKHG